MSDDTNAKAIDLLEGSLKLLNGGERWAKNSYAATREGITVAPFDPNAYQFCIVGALECTHARLTGSKEILPRTAQWRVALDAIESITGIRRITDWNDRSEWPEVEETLTRAIGRLKESE